MTDEEKKEYKAAKKRATSIAWKKANEERVRAYQWVTYSKGGSENGSRPKSG